MMETSAQAGDAASRAPAYTACGLLSGKLMSGRREGAIRTLPKTLDQG
jgi:hypothetical protein